MRPLHPTLLPQPLHRREFVSQLLTLAGAATITALPGLASAASISAKNALTVQQVIDLILKQVPDAPFPNTVDTIKAGHPDQVVTGIVTTMFATAAVIEKAASLGANFIIAHEPTFYSHTDDTAGLQNDTVFQAKKSLLEKHGMAVWRFHDSIHAHKPDGVLMGVLTALGWANYYDQNNPLLVTIPTTSLQQIIALTKKNLGIPHVRYVGALDDRCSRILLIPGAAGGKMQMAALRKEKPDLLMVGEVDEWETSEYIRDLRQSGGKAALLVLGHVVSEKPGLEWLVRWLQPQLPNIRITHVPSTDAFQWA